MFSNDNHPENRNNGKGFDFLKNEKDVSRLANHMANMTEHMISLTVMIKTLTQEIHMQKRAFNHLKHLILRSNRPDEDDDDFMGLN